MDTRYVITWMSGLLIGAVGGGLGGYMVSSSKGTMRGENHAVVTTTDLDAMLRTDYEAWVQYMKDAGAWHGE